MADSIDKLNIEIKSSATSALKELDKLSNKLTTLGTALGGLKTDGLAKLKTELSGIAQLNIGSTGLENFGKAVSKASNSLAGLSSISTTEISTKLKETSEAFKGFNIDANLTTDISGFGKGLKSFVSAAKSISTIDYDQFAENIKKVTEAIKPLTDEMLRAGPAASSYGTQIKEMAQAAKTASKMTEGSQKRGGFYRSGALAFKLSNIKTAVSMLRTSYNQVTKMVDGINKYVENVNLFSVALGDFAEQAGEFSNELELKLGADSSQVMRYMGFFQQLETSFGVVGEQAYKMSKNFTQLGYDLSSFLNIDIDEAMLKLQSGLAGKLFCLIRRGLRIVTYLNGEQLTFVS